MDPALTFRQLAGAKNARGSLTISADRDASSQIIGAVQVSVQAVAVVLCQDIDLVDPTVEAVADGYVDESVDSTDRDCRQRAFVRLHGTAVRLSVHPPNCEGRGVSISPGVLPQQVKAIYSAMVPAPVVVLGTVTYSPGRQHTGCFVLVVSDPVSLKSSPPLVLTRGESRLESVSPPPRITVSRWWVARGR